MSDNTNATVMQNDILTATQDINNVLTSGNVSPVFQGHVFNMETGKHGIENLIIEILTKNGAVFAAGVETTALRKIAIGKCMFADEVLTAVQKHFTAGSTRYPYSTIHSYLSVFMSGKKGNGKLGKIKLSGVEDDTRECCKPRCKFYVVEKAV